MYRSHFVMQFTNQLLLEFRHNSLIYKHPIAGYIELSILSLGELGGGGGVRKGMGRLRGEGMYIPFFFFF